MKTLSYEVGQRALEPSTAAGRLRSRALTRLVIASRFSSAWLALAVLLIVDALAIPKAVSADAFSTVLPLTAVLAVASLGQLLVIMNAGIDLSVPGVITMCGSLTVGLSHGSDSKMTETILITIAVAGLVGLLNGVLVVVARITPVIATLATGGVVLGWTTGYRNGLTQAAAVPTTLAHWASARAGSVSGLFLFALALTALLSLIIRCTVVGRRFQIVGGNPRAAWIAGIAVRRYQISAYTAAGALYGISGIILASFIQTPTIDIGDPYLLAPIAAVVIAGTSLAGGTGSVFATFAAALFLTLLSQTLRVLGLSSAWQYVIFGTAVASGLLLSGDRILRLIGAWTVRGAGGSVWRDRSESSSPRVRADADGAESG